MAVYTKISFDEAKEILTEYGFQKLDILQGISEGILNTNYLIKGDKGKYILRILEGKRDFKEEVKELNLLLDLKNNGFPCTSPVLTNNNNLFTTYKGKFVTLFHFIEGEKLTEFNDSQIKEIGYTLGKFHSFSKNKSINRLKKIDMDYLFNKITDLKVDLKNIFKSDYKLIMDKYDSIKDIDFSNVPQGIIHNDIFPDNVFYKGNKISGLIDFNDSLGGGFLLDIAIVLNFWIKSSTPTKKEEERLKQVFLDSYNKYREITQEEYLLLDHAMTKIALTFIFLRAYKFEIEDNTNVQMEKKSYKDLLYLLK